LIVSAPFSRAPRAPFGLRNLLAAAPRCGSSRLQLLADARVLVGLRRELLAQVAILLAQHASALHQLREAFLEAREFRIHLFTVLEFICRVNA
jgi:hypothetical protein